MTSLEFINKEIEKCEQSIQQAKTRMHKNENYPFLVGLYTERIEEIESFLQPLHQIKTELEIMQLIKNGWSGMETTLNGDQIMRFQNLKLDDWLKLWGKLEEILLKKALEVKDE